MRSLAVGLAAALLAGCSSPPPGDSAGSPESAPAATEPGAATPAALVERAMRAEMRGDWEEHFLTIAPEDVDLMLAYVTIRCYLHLNLHSTAGQIREFWTRLAAWGIPEEWESDPSVKDGLTLREKAAIHYRECTDRRAAYAFLSRTERTYAGDPPAPVEWEFAPGPEQGDDASGVLRVRGSASSLRFVRKDGRWYQSVSE